MDLAIEARQFLRTAHHGILSTHSAKFAGYPFGSVTPFVLDYDCQPIILISSIAEHTKNIIANAKVSLVIFEKNEDLQANARLTLIGEAAQINKNDANLLARYGRYFPESIGYFAIHDFQFYRINIHQARYIAGFGKMGWLDASALNQPQNKIANKVIAELEDDMIEHMNVDHAESLMQYCQHFYKVKPASVSLIGVDTDGFDVEATIEDFIKILRFNFDAPIFDAHSARLAFVALSKVTKNDWPTKTEISAIGR